MYDEQGEIQRNLVSDKTIKLWKVSEKEWRVEGLNLKEDGGSIRDASAVTSLQVRLGNSVLDTV